MFWAWSLCTLQANSCRSHSNLRSKSWVTKRAFPRPARALYRNPQSSTEPWPRAATRGLNPCGTRVIPASLLAKANSQQCLSAHMEFINDSVTEGKTWPLSVTCCWGVATSHTQAPVFWPSACNPCQSCNKCLNIGQVRGAAAPSFA